MEPKEVDTSNIFTYPQIKIFETFIERRQAGSDQSPRHAGAQVVQPGLDLAMKPLLRVLLGAQLAAPSCARLQLLLTCGGSGADDGYGSSVEGY